MKALFKLGRVVATPAAAAFLKTYEINILIARHATGDWSEMNSEAQAIAGEAVNEGYTIETQYRVRGQAIQIITREDRTETLILFARERSGQVKG
jgi:hypothetical protein